MIDGGRQGLGAAQETADAKFLALCLTSGDWKEHHAGSVQAVFKDTFKETESLWTLPWRHVSLNLPSLSFLTCKLGLL